MSGRIASVVLAVSLLGCAPQADDGLPRRWGETMPLDGDRLEVLITCFKAVTLAQQRHSGMGEKTGRIGKGLERARVAIEARVVSDFNRGDEKMRINARVEERLQKLLQEREYGSTQVLLDTAYACADFERRNAWESMRPHR